ncbi:hypothetical protein HDV00_004423 [Rhizophlyctis rosea]|nr:hypothetical protein HDV00_004423 [Rhizophlyctis rosea]
MGGGIYMMADAANFSVQPVVSGPIVNDNVWIDSTILFKQVQPALRSLQGAPPVRSRATHLEWSNKPAALNQNFPPGAALPAFSVVALDAVNNPAYLDLQRPVILSLSMPTATLMGATQKAILNTTSHVTFDNLILNAPIGEHQLTIAAVYESMDVDQAIVWPNVTITVEACPYGTRFNNATSTCAKVYKVTDTSRIAFATASAIGIAIAITCAATLYLYQSAAIIAKNQPRFQYMIAAGSVISLASIISSATPHRFSCKLPRWLHTFGVFASALALIYKITALGTASLEAEVADEQMLVRETSKKNRKEKAEKYRSVRENATFKNATVNIPIILTAHRRRASRLQYRRTVLYH